MINVKILTREHGHQTASLSVEELETKVYELGEHRVTVFQDGLPVDVANLKDEVDAVIIPRFVAG